MIKFIKFLLMSMGMIFMLVACGGDKEKTEATPETQGSNELVIYSPNADDEVNKIIPAFEEATGIKVILQSMGSGDVLARISAEKENPQADINWGAISMGVLATTPDLWESYTSENEKNVPDAYKNTTGFFTNYKLDGSAALLVNKDVFKKLGLDPEKFNGYKDLLNLIGITRNELNNSPISEEISSVDKPIKWKISEQNYPYWSSEMTFSISRAPIEININNNFL